MATVHWINGAGGSWQTAANWSTGAVPGATDDVIIDAAGSYTVTSTASVTVNSLQTIATVTLDIVSSGFALTNGTGSGVNAGTIIDDNGSTLSLGGTVNNTGTIRENSTGSTTDTRLSSASVTLTGGGQFTMSDNANNRIYGNAAADTLVNVNNTISGAGQLGADQMTLVNQAGGTIDATGTANALIINTGANVVSNAGLIESTTSGGLVLQNTTFNDTAGGTIAASGKGALVELAGATIQGGTISESGGGVVETVGGNGALDGTSATVTIKGGLLVSDATILYLGGTINNTGTITENSTGDTTDIRLSYPVVTLTGGGTIAMSNNANNRIFGNGSGYLLNNVNNTISGAGQLGAGQIVLNNEKQGVIDANQTTQMILNSQAIITNAGLIEATGTGGLLIQNTTISNAGGTVLAAGSGAFVNLGGSTIEGGTLAASGGGAFKTVSGNGALDGTTDGAVTLNGTVNVTDATILSLSGTIVNGGTIALASTVDTTDIRLAGPVVTLTGGGAVTLSNSDSNYIYGNASTDQLVNVNNVISGTGQLGDAQMTLLNEKGGVIDANNAPIANLSSGKLVINCNDGVTNQGLIEDTNTAGLSIVNTTVDNAGGTITATGAGSHVDLSGTVIEGGTIASAGGGVVNDVSNSFLDGYESGIGAVSNTGSVIVVSGQVLTLDGTIDNSGNILIDSAGSTTELRVGTQNVTLQGGGSVTLTDNANNYIFGNVSDFTLTNVDNTISGGGQLGDGQMQLSNSGTINGNGTNALVLNFGSYDGTNNAGGLIEATGVGGVSVTSGIISNAGTIAANGGNLTFGSSAFNLNAVNGTLSGGTWEAANGTLAITGGAVVTDAASIVLSGATGTFEAGNGSSFTGLGASLTTVASGGALSLLNHASLAVTAASLSDFGSITFGGGTLTVKSLTTNGAGTVSGNGTIKGSVTDNTSVTASGGLLDITANILGKGVLTIDNGATAEVGIKLGVKSVVFASGGTETLDLGKPAGATAVISGFAGGDVIDLTKTAATSLSYSGNTTSGVLTVKNGSTTVATLNFSGDYTTSSFALSSDGGTGTKITETGAASMSPPSLVTTPSLADFPLGVTVGAAMPSEAHGATSASLAAWHAPAPELGLSVLHPAHFGTI